jgi:hypothetical protein
MSAVFATTGQAEYETHPGLRKPEGLVTGIYGAIFVRAEFDPQLGRMRRVVSNKTPGPVRV